MALIKVLALFWCFIAAAGVDVNMPFQVVRPSADHLSMTIVPDGLARLAQHKGGISLISVVGPYHSGKSFLLNALLHHTQVFTIGSKTSPETMGIWMCRTNLTASDGTEVWLMDSEGFFGPGVEESYDAKVFAVASLIGAHVVYNTVKVIDQQAVGLLEMLVQRAQLFKTRTQSGTTPDLIPDFLKTDTFPPLTWVVEDFVQDLPSQLKDEGATGWLRTYLDASRVVQTKEPEEEPAKEAPSTATSEGSNSEGKAAKGGEVVLSTTKAPTRTEIAKKSDFLRRIYRDVRVHTLFLPATGREQLRDLSRLPFEQLTPEFKEEVGELRRHMLRSLRARTSNGQPMNGASVAASLRFLVQGLQQGMFHELPSIWNAWAQQVVTVSLNDADAWFGALISKIDDQDVPVGISVFNDRLDEAKENATKFYLALLRDFDTTPQVAELRKRMEGRITGATAAYHERIRKWVGERASSTKEMFARFLASISLPTEPSYIDREGGQKADQLQTHFGNELTVFSFVKARGRGSYTQLVGMPVFNPDPVTQLSNDLRALLGAKAMENERSIQQLFKFAIASVEKAIVQELTPHSANLLSKARLAELRTSAEKRCWEALDSHLADYPWAKSIMHYKSTKALVKTDYLEARLSAFSADNEKRLTAFFGSTVDRAIAGYAANRSSVVMPASEADVESRHTSMAAAARQLLQQQGKELSDTDSYASAAKRLDSVLVEYFNQLKDKNVELWKVHSDEATRCALARNRAVEKNCGVLCLYKTIPWYHKRTARHHLSECFAQSTSGQQMALPLRSSVFEMWYAKDLARDAARVSNRFTMLVITFLVLACGLFYCIFGRRPQPRFSVPTTGYYPPQYGAYPQRASGFQLPGQVNQFHDCDPGPGYCGQVGGGLRQRTYGYFGA